MGLSLHYRGKLADIQQVEAIRDELADIAATMKWPYTTLDEDWSKPAAAELVHTEQGAEIVGHLPLKGIQFTPHPECESVGFFFDPEGNLRDIMSMLLLLDGRLTPEQARVSVKTQFAPPEVHITIVKLLKYLKTRYIPDLEVFDEGDYWETGDEELLKQKMGFLAEKLDALEDALSSPDVPDLSHYSLEDMASIIEEIIRKKLEMEDE